jgi:hypothetical protein
MKPSRTQPTSSGGPAVGVEVDVSGLLRVLHELPARVAVANHHAAAQAGLVYERFIKEEIRGGHPKNTKTGATPGGPPQNITGNLRRSVTVSPVKDEGFAASVEIGPSASYGGFVEGGTTRMPAYPYTRPGAQKAEDSGAVAAVVVAAWRRGLGV